ncbi:MULTISPECIES: CHAT domain-containing protein [Nostocales]|uniref:CHAT domain-containing protein n=1 Tax=Nostocales TaxID=1161 RepID=UPI00029B7148|nr:MULTISPECIES: CHAT domain-containing tetratricopeptide repeat protein [Nostocales]AFW95770.1 TPR repeat-containing protein [Anabaena sp. 90]MTJ18876.1 CHAT domain-containing protein [Dolichospermum sp. UHCC 0299]MTJ21061.1 CHAT domain-containing protein [Dolichospermum sp. UHCC 0352]MTJ41506.1 CHAT domain-containing protein [Dolichospermum sp. UHCC 0406]
MAKGFGKKQKKGKLKRRDYLEFLHKILWTIRENKADTTIKILEDNVDKLDKNFISIFRDWATETLSQLEPDKAYKRALSIANLSKNIRHLRDGNQSNNLNLAILCCEVIEIVFNSHIDREDWAINNLNLASLYMDKFDSISFSEQQENIEIAIHYCKFASEIFNSKKYKYGLNWAFTQAILGRAYSEILTQNITEKTEYLELAIAAYNNDVLDIFKQNQCFEEWAKCQMNLGIIYDERNRIKGEKNPENYNLALTAYQEALKVYNPKNLPIEYAQVQYNLAITYEILGKIDAAINCYKISFDIFKSQGLPSKLKDVADKLGYLAFQYQFWETAIEAYKYAIEAVEKIRTWSNSEQNREEFLEKYIEIYQNIVQAYINTNQIDKAFEYCQRSRSQRLVDLMASFNLSQGENIPPKVQELLQKYEELKQKIHIERQNYKSENNRRTTRAIWQVYDKKIELLETAKQKIWEQLRGEDPILAGEIQVKPLRLSKIQKLIDHPKTAILSFYTTNSDTHIFIITQDSIYLHTCIGEGLERLQNWIKHHWSSPYQEYVEKKFKDWEYNMEYFLYELSERLQLSKIIHQYLQNIKELIIEPHLLLHQIPFAALPTGENKKYLVDRFLIRYTPSCQILDFCHQNQKKKRLNLDVQYFQYGTVADTVDNDPLPFSRWEEEEIAKMYNIPANKRLIGSSQATVQNFRKLAENVQTLHCCHHAVSCLYNPLESHLNLGGGDSITLGQLMSPSWRFPNLVDVFLSCCETNLGQPNITDNLLTLSTGFLCAGATNIISSLWMVDDLATALLSIFYYQQRQEGKNCPAALKEAQIKLRELRKADLEEISQAAENQRQQARNQKKQYPQDSEEYLECDLQHKKSLKILNTINNIQKSKGEFPFAHPRYWSAFIAQGLQ